MSQRISLPTLQPRLHLLSEEQLLAIHHASLDILSQTGIVIKHAAARELLLTAGAGESDGRQKIPPHLVADAIASATSRIPMHNRLGQLTMPLEADQVFFGTGSDCLFTIDIETGGRRARKILAEHQTPPLPEAAEAMISQVLRARADGPSSAS